MDSGPSHDQTERFARALDADSVDAEFANELAIVAALGELDLGPDEQARERMLAKATPPPVSSRRSRFLVAVAAAVVLVFALAGMSLLLSRDALPGDTLYGVKRTAEAASLGLTFGDESKALKYLEFAAARVDEVETLAQRTDPTEAPVGGYLTALTDFDADATQASRQLIALATRGDVQQLDSLRSWSTQQSTRLAAVNGHLPAPVQTRAATSRKLLDTIADRSAILLGRADCYQITSGNTDDIGALPATDACHRDTASTIKPSAPDVPGPTTVPPRLQASYPSPPPVSTAPTPPPATTSQPALPLVPSSVPTPSRPVPPLPTPPQLPVPILEVPPLLPGLPAIRVG
nr:DUF5667 domain-containing protein [Kibdelosporangium sp. MJ126-NF4]CEL14990.1 FIG01121847: hypothetical protein [Kibdelosporangium sp. MJ126-NF4]CTQ93416.1 FIG01121847: hypothetical protein [Kibdelosporangium sp. MJ126-NF4]